MWDEGEYPFRPTPFAITPFAIGYSMPLSRRPRMTCSGPVPS